MTKRKITLTHLTMPGLMEELEDGFLWGCNPELMSREGLSSEELARLAELEGFYKAKEADKGANK